MISKQISSHDEIFIARSLSHILQHADWLCSMFMRSDHFLTFFFCNNQVYCRFSSMTKHLQCMWIIWHTFWRAPPPSVSIPDLANGCWLIYTLNTYYIVFKFVPWRNSFRFWHQLLDYRGCGKLLNMEWRELGNCIILTFKDT